MSQNRNKLQFISVFNHGGIELAKNHLNSLITHGITNYTAYCTDRETENILKSLNYNVEYINFEIDSSKLDFSTPDFNKLSYLRYAIIMKLLNQGYDVWYMDIDTVVLDNLNTIYEQYRLQNNTDIIFQNDVNMLCTGCMLFFKTNMAMELVRMQLDVSRNPETFKYNDQLILNHILKTSNNKVRIGVFPIFQFPNGLLYFKEDFIKTEVPQYIKLRNDFRQSSEKILFVHANWMVSVDTKINALKSHGLWINTV
jgi:hypothetical protein